jgi:hypothetical protein
MDALASQYDTLLEKQQQLNNVIPSRIDSIRELLLETKKSFENGTYPCNAMDYCTQCVNNKSIDPSSWKESLVMLEQRNKKNNFQKELKEYSSSVSKYGKAIEKVTRW